MILSNNGPQSIGQIAKYFQFGDLFLSPFEYQRVNAWDQGQKELLIDTIFRGFDVPKFYLWKVDQNTLQTGYPDGDAKDTYRAKLNHKYTENNDPNPFIYEVVDGQQRLRTIFEYMGVNPPNADVHRGLWLPPYAAMQGTPIAGGKPFAQLNADQQLKFESRTLSVVVLEQANIDEIRDMFLRLQNGTPLNAQQKRDALGSSVGNFAKSLASHKYFTASVAFEDYSSEHTRVAAQIINLETKQRIESCTSRQLDKLYKQYHASMHIEPTIQRKIKRVLDLLASIFQDRSLHINRSYALSLYWSLARVTDQYSIPESDYPKIRSNFEQMDLHRVEASLRDYNQDGDEVFRDLSDSMSSRTDGKEGIEDRNEIITQFLFRDVTLVPIPELDPRRIFTEEEKLILYSRCGGRCQLGHDGVICDRQIDYHDAVVDHVVPHSKGGKTELSNGRIAHRVCNIARQTNELFDPRTQCAI